MGLKLADVIMTDCGLEIPKLLGKMVDSRTREENGQDEADPG